METARRGDGEGRRADREREGTTTYTCLRRVVTIELSPVFRPGSDASKHLVVLGTVECLSLLTRRIIYLPNRHEILIVSFRAGVISGRSLLPAKVCRGLLSCAAAEEFAACFNEASAASGAEATQRFELLSLDLVIGNKKVLDLAYQVFIQRS